jgi:hypothetical protein
MTADRECDARSLPDDAVMATFVLRVRVGPEEAPFSGSIGTAGQSAFSFHGWIDFMATINKLRTEAFRGRK